MADDVMPAGLLSLLPVRCRDRERRGEATDRTVRVDWHVRGRAAMASPIFAVSPH